MGDRKTVLGHLARSGQMAITASFQNLATLIAADQSVDAKQVFYVSDVVAASGTFTFQYGTTSGDTYEIAGTDYSTKKAECVGNAADCWIKGSGAINVNYIAYIERA